MQPDQRVSKYFCHSQKVRYAWTAFCTGRVGSLFWRTLSVHTAEWVGWDHHGQILWETCICELRLHGTLVRTSGDACCQQNGDHEFSIVEVLGTLRFVALRQWWTQGVYHLGRFPTPPALDKRNNRKALAWAVRSENGGQTKWICCPHILWTEAGVGWIEQKLNTHFSSCALWASQPNYWERERCVIQSLLHDAVPKFGWQL